MKIKGGQAVRIWIAVVLLAFLVGVFMYTKKCDDYSCFASYLRKCNKASYIDNAKDSSWQYTIKGDQGGKCMVDVKLLVVKAGGSDLEELQNQKMTCYVFTGRVDDPRSDLTKCTGELKENIQDILIQKMHAYILENVGKISEEFQNIA